MTGGTADKPQPGKAPEPAAREARLAEALRANLRRRKAAARPTTSPSPVPLPSETD